MKIYHGSLEVVEKPMILNPNRQLDYGNGFYTTTSEQQSKEWVRRRMREKSVNGGYVNVYEFDEIKKQELKCLVFSEPSKEWADFVMANRTQKGFTHDYDIVYGPVAMIESIYNLGYMKVGLSVLRPLFENLKLTNWLTSTCFIQRKHWRHYISLKLLK